MRSVLAWLLCLPVLALAQGELLNSVGIKPDVESIRTYFQGLGDTAEDVEGRFEQLGDDSYKVRRAAFNYLRLRPHLPREPLASALRDEDPEVRHWAGRLRGEALHQGENILMEVLRTITGKELKGLLPELLTLQARYADKGSLAFQVRLALMASLQDEDLPRLRRELQRAPQPLLLVLLEHQLGKEVLPELSTWMKHDAPELRFEAAKLAMRHNDRRALLTLAELPDEAGDGMLPEAVSMLRSLTGEKHDSRTAWTEWITEHGATATLYALDHEGVLHQRLLVAIWDANEVVEYDQAGKVTWRTKLSNATGVQGLRNGNRLVVGHSGDAVQEFDAAGKQVWQVKPPGESVWAQRLADGTTHVATEKEMLLYDADGKEVSRVALPGGRVWFCARRLPSGNCLITLCDRNVVIEVNPKGKEVWSIDGEKRFRDARRLPSGNTLVVELGGRVLEYNPGKKIVWESPKDLPTPVSARRLLNGTTRVVTREGIVDIAADGTLTKLLSVKMAKTPNGGSHY